MARPAYSLQQREEIEASIQQTALKLLGQVGYRAVSLRSIARELGLSAPALYRYYENKEALFGALRAGGFNQLGELLKTVREEADSGVVATEKAMRTYIAFGLDNPELYSLMYELDQRDITDIPSVKQSRSQAFSQAEIIAQDILRENNLAGDANQLAHLMWINAHGLVALAVANQLDLGQELDQMIEPVLQLLLRGVTQENSK